MRPATLATLAALLACSTALAADLPVKDEPYHLTVAVGAVAEICDTGFIGCPAGAGRCDDPKVAIPAFGKLGLGFQGVGPGETLCSAGASGSGARRVFRVTVTGPARPAAR
jgi:hypothetical protein